MTGPFQAVVREIADAATERAADATVCRLADMEAQLSGEGSGLANVWEEFCVQVQGEESVSWDVYEDTARLSVAAGLDALSPAELRAIWLQTDAGTEWADEHEDEGELPPYCEADVVEHVYALLWQRAANDEGKRIRRYLDSRYGDEAEYESDDDEALPDDEAEEDADDGADDNRADRDRHSSDKTAGVFDRDQPIRS